ncbi:MAG: hypothetical protein RLZZ217_1362, partial [Planctomycetota bacterium]
MNGAEPMLAAWLTADDLWTMATAVLASV